MLNNMKKEPEIPYGIKCLGILLLVFFGVILLIMQPAVFAIIALSALGVWLDLDSEKIMLGLCGIIIFAGMLFIIVFSVVGLYNTTLDFFNYVAMNIK